MAEFQALLDFPPATKLNVFGKLNPAKASGSEMRGQEIFFGRRRIWWPSSGCCRPRTLA